MGHVEFMLQYALCDVLSIPVWFILASLLVKVEWHH